jgi:DNA modification methylase
MAVIEQVVTEKYAIYNGDCIEVMGKIPDKAIHLSVHSPPFGGLFQYSSSDRDLSNHHTYEGFFEHYGFVVREIARITMAGRMSAVHCMDVPSGNTGTDYMTDFPGDIIRLHAKEGFDYIARYAVWKEPLAVRNRTMAKNLAHRSLVEDSSRCSVAAADYLLVFRRRGENKIPITHPNGLMEYAGERKIPVEVLKYRGWEGNQIENRYSHWIWRQYASAFWDDVRIGRVLPFKQSKDDNDEKHVHALQLDVIDRVLTLWSNPRETVLTPFMGVGSEVYSAVRLGRLGIGIELKPSYFRQSVKNVAMAADSSAERLEQLEMDVDAKPEWLEPAAMG